MATPPARALCAAPTQLSGVWQANDGGTYSVRRVGNTVWWLGMSGDGGRTWTNIFRGTLTGNLIQGEWSDVRGGIGGSGTLTLRLTPFSQMEKVGSSGSGFGGSRWNRPCNDVIQNPVN